MIEVWPYRKIIKNSLQYRRHIALYNGKHNIFRSVYHFNEKDGKVDFTHPKINTVYFDFDDHDSSNSAIVNVKEFTRKLKENNIRFRVNFSGRGFHVYVAVEEGYTKSYLKSLHNYIANKYNLDNVDTSSFGDIRRLRRVENTLNLRANLYCIPLFYDELHDDGKEIRIPELAKNPRDFDVHWIGGNVLKLEENYVEPQINENQTIKRSEDGRFTETEFLPEPCIARILNIRHPSHEERFLLCLWLSYKFRGGKDINDFNPNELIEKIIAYMRKLNWDDYSESVTTSKSTRYQVTNIIRKKYNFVPNKSWREMYGICINGCDTCERKL